MVKRYLKDKLHVNEEEHDKLLLKINRYEYHSKFIAVVLP